MMRSAAIISPIVIALALAGCSQQQTSTAGRRSADATRTIERDTTTVVDSAGNQTRDVAHNVASGTRQAAIDVHAHVPTPSTNVTVNLPGQPAHTTTTRRTILDANGRPVTNETTRSTSSPG